MTTNIPAVQSNSIRHGMLIDLDINGTQYYLSNLYGPITFNGNSYTQQGNFMQITEIQDDLRATNNQLTVSLTGLPTGDGAPNYLALALTSNIKGSKIQIRRVFFNTSTGGVINAYLRFNGYIANYALQENYDEAAQLMSNTISVQCSSINAIIERQYSGRRTNEKDQQFWYPNDTGMYKVRSLADSQFDFGKPYSAPSSAAPAPAPGGDSSFSGGY